MCHMDKGEKIICVILFYWDIYAYQSKFDSHIDHQRKEK